LEQLSTFEQFLFTDELLQRYAFGSGIMELTTGLSVQIDAVEIREKVNKIAVRYLEFMDSEVTHIERAGQGETNRVQGAHEPVELNAPSCGCECVMCAGPSYM
jgi:hypothetical protein